MKKRKKELFWKNCKQKELQILHWKCLIWAFLGWNFQRTIDVFQITSQEFVKMQCFFQNKENFTFETKNALFGNFKREFEKTIVVVDASNLEFVKKQSSAQNKKCSSLGLKSLDLGFGCNFEKLVSYLKSAPSNLWKIKFLVNSEV